MDAIALARCHLWLALEGFHCPQLTRIFRNSRPLCTIHWQIPSLMPLEMRNVQLSYGRVPDSSPGTLPTPPCATSTAPTG